MAELTSYGCLTRMHVVRLLAPASPMTITPRTSISAPRASVSAGRRDMPTRGAPSRGRLGQFGAPLDGVILHEPQPGAEPGAEMQPGKPAPAQPPQKLAAE